MMLAILMVLAVAPMPPAPVGPDRGEELVRAARSGDESARGRIRDALLRQTPEGREAIARLHSIPEIMTTAEDAWVSDTLRTVALQDKTRLSVKALVAWWRLTGGTDLSLPHDILQRPLLDDDDGGLQLAAIELLRPLSDQLALRVERKFVSASCADSKRGGRFGLLFREPSALHSNAEQKIELFELVVAQACPQSPAERAGFLPGDKVLAVNGVECGSWSTCKDAIDKARINASTVVVRVRTTTNVEVVRRLARPSDEGAPSSKTAP